MLDPIESMEAEQAAKKVKAILDATIPNARIETRHVGDGRWAVTMNYACPCGENSGMMMVIDHRLPPEFFAMDIIERLRHHVISEGNTPNF